MENIAEGACGCCAQLAPLKECEEWNLNRLLTLIRVFDAKAADQNPDSKKKLTQTEIMRRHRELNAKRLKGGKRG